MKKIFFCISIVVFANANAYSQKWYTKNGLISFFSTTKVKDIKADNNQVLSTIDLKTGDIQFSVLINGFHFENATMEEHFNDIYMESATYPKATFKGKITNLSQINFKKDGVYKTNVSGDLTIHGVTKPNFSTDGTLTISKGKISTNSKFSVAVKDYKINVSKIFSSRIAETIEITVQCSYPNKM